MFPLYILKIHFQGRFFMTAINLIELMECPDWYGILLLVLLCLVAVFSIVCCSVTQKGRPFNFLLLFIIVFGLAFIVLTSDAAMNRFKVPSGKFHVEAIFTDDMPFNAVMKEYNIVEQRGNVFVLEPKERIVN